ncbi:MAG: hypothetical protein ACJ739_02815 [Acidimicrobiales bacterium]
MKARRLAGAVAPLILLAALVGAAAPAGADPAQAGSGTAYGINAAVGGSDVIPPTPEASAEAPPFPADASETVVEVPADPLIVSGTFNADVAIHKDANVPSALEVEEQSLAGPYNASSVGSVDETEVLVDAVADDIPLVEADLIRGEVVAKCVGNAVQYSAQSEAVNLVVGGDSSLGDAANDIIDQLFPGLDPLDPIINLQETVVTQLQGGGMAVDAVVVTVLEAAGESPLAEVRLGHAELSGVTCGADAGGGTPPQCSDTKDNDGDGVIDADDPGCHSDGNADNPDSYVPNDDDETNGGAPACSDGVDNDGDSKIDTDDPGCHTDGDATNPNSFDANDDDENDGDVSAGNELPLTGGSAPLAAGFGLLAAFAAVELVRRRATT